MEDKKITQQESLEIITMMIERTRRRYIGDGNIMLMWGYVTVAVAAAVWLLLVFTHNPAWNWLWFLIWIVGGILTPVMDRKNVRERGMKSYSDKITSRIWTVVGFSAIVATLCCLVLTLAGGIDAWPMMLAFALIIVPFAEIAQGIVLAERSLVAGGAIGLAVGIFTNCCLIGDVPLNVNWYLPLFIFAFIAMMIVPGHILNHKCQKSNQ